MVTKRQFLSLIFTMIFIVNLISVVITPINANADIIFKTYDDLTENQLKALATVCQSEQGTVKGASAEASMMANHMDMGTNKAKNYPKTGQGLYDYVKNSGWFAKASSYMDTFKTGNSDHADLRSDVLEEVRSVLVYGKRTLPGYIDEHDYVGDISSVKNNGVSFDKKDKSQYKQHTTVITNTMGSVYTFYSFPTSSSDGFGYTSSSQRASIGDAYYDYYTKEPVNDKIPPQKELVTPTISTDKSSYIVGDTVNISWVASPSGSNLSHYWLQIISPDGSTLLNETMNKNTSYSFKPNQSGSYKIVTFATPLGSKEGEGSLTDTKTITVAEAVPKGKELASGAGQTLPDGDYYIFSAIDRNYYLDMAGRECPAPSGTNVEMYTSTTGFPNAYDAWTIKYLGNGFYKIKQKGTNMCLDVNGASLDRGTNVQLWTENTSTAQQWSIVRTDTGYKIQSRCSSFYLDVNGGVFETGTNVQVWEGNTSAAQRFSFVPYAPSIGQTIADGTYTIASGMDTTYGFDVQGYDNTAYTSGTNVQLWEISDGNDLFDVKYLGNGYYSICESISGLSLNIYNKEPSMYLNVNQNLQMYTYEDTSNERWIIRDAGDGYYYIISALSGYYIDLSGAIVEPRRNISQYTYNGSNAQKWKFESLVSAPSKCEVVADKETALAGEKITFTATADNATAYTLKISKDGEQIKAEPMVDEKTALTFDEAGVYSVSVTASNRSGSVNSKEINIDIKTDITLHDSEKYALPFGTDYTYKTNNSDVVVVSKSGIITAVGMGKAVISVIDADSNVTQLKLNVLSEIMIGDANCDGEVNMADAVLIMQSLANPDKYGINGTDTNHITAQGEKNGDMDGNGLTNADALEIQKMMLKLS